MTETNLILTLTEEFNFGVFRHGLHEVLTDGLETGKHEFFHRRVEEV